MKLTNQQTFIVDESYISWYAPIHTPHLLVGNFEDSAQVLADDRSQS
jgi:hypothetical protein